MTAVLEFVAERSATILRRMPVETSSIEDPVPVFKQHHEACAPGGVYMRIVPADVPVDPEHSLLTWPIVHEIRRRWLLAPETYDGITKTELAEEFGVSIDTITAVLEQRTWISPTWWRRRPLGEQGGHAAKGADS